MENLNEAVAYNLDEDKLEFESEVSEAEVEYDHGENLALQMSDEDLNALGAELVELVEKDIQSREDHVKLFAKGLKVFASPNEEVADSEQLFKGASTVILPTLTEAVVQFHARAAQELFPPQGPVKSKIQGEVTQERIAQAKRVEDALNYYLTDTLEYYYDDNETLLVYLALQGSAFRKIYIDHNGETQDQFIEAENAIVPYLAMDMRSAPRFTHRIYRTKNELRRDFVAGVYREIELGDPPNRTPNEAQKLKDKLQGQAGTGEQEPGYFEVYEVHTEWDLPGFESESEDDIALPYIITIERDSGKVLAVRRNWQEEDSSYAPEMYFVHYKYFPGPGFYGLGLIHLIGGLSSAATDALRSMLDAAAFSNMPGGFKQKGIRMEGGVIEVGPGDWEDIDYNGDDIRKAVMPLPYKGPEPAMFQLLGLLQESAQRLSSTMEVMVGDASSTSPVGTTVALIEQGSKVYSGIHARLHRAQKREFRLLAERLYESGYIYPYQNEDVDPEQAQEDFDQRIDIVPVSDPKIFSQTQRIAQAQTVLEVAETDPQAWNMHKVRTRFLDAIGVEEIEEILPDPSQVQPLDPMSENMAVLMGQPITTFQWEHHDAHLMVHEAFLMEHMENELTAEVVVPALQAHIQEHLAYQYQMRIMQMFPQPLPVPDLKGGDGQEPLPPEILNQVAMLTAQAVSAMEQEKPPTPEELEAQAMQEEMAQKEAAAQSDIVRKDTESQAKMQRDDLRAITDIERKDTESKAKIKRDDLVTAADVERQTTESQSGIKNDTAQTVTDVALADQESDAKVRNMDRKTIADIRRQDRMAEIQAKLAEKKAQAAERAAKQKPAKKGE